MKTASIISIGTEIMRGKIDDTNSTFIARWLKECGIVLKYRLNVADEETDIINAIKNCNESDLIIFTGGLGPTDDDLTREAVSRYLGKKLVLNEESWQKIQAFFKERKFLLAKSNIKQAYCIEGGEHIPNDNGTAPGVFYNDNNQIYALLPGPPSENAVMIKTWLFNKLKQSGFIDGELFAKIFRVYNVGESLIADKFADFKEDIEIGYYFTKDGWVEIHLTKFISNKNEISKIQPIIEKTESIFKKNNFFYTENEDLSALVLKKLIEKNKTIAFAESITGGGLSAEFVKNPSASKSLLGGIVAYSNEIKKNLLNVKNETLLSCGAVSEETVTQMCFGLKEKIGADINVSISGIAGPEGGSQEKPVGLVYFGFLFDDELVVKKEIFSYGNRQRIINRSLIFTYCELLKRLR
ncbi:MAG TPA: CinA family nicotinamide mononucleotide deamidase-related protein [Spirochaetota bacterium]|nr:CinA family nicotinamide mononucleotide deamidase-related protein [Spirochaetota bacterium]